MKTKNFINKILLSIFIYQFSLVIYGQGLNVMATSDAPQYIYVGSLLSEKNTGLNQEKIKIEIFGDGFYSNRLATTTYSIATREGYQINKEVRGGFNAHHSLIIYENGDKLDIVIKSNGWADFNLKAWILDSYYKEQPIEFKVYNPSGKKNITSQFIETLFLTSSANGNIGVGVLNPQHKLDVAGNISSQNFVLSHGGMITPFLSQDFTYNSKKVGLYSILWSPDDWDKGASSLYLSSYGGIKLFTGGAYRVGISKFGNVGIGTDNPKNKLDVAGTIRATEVKIEATPWADFVFDKDYKLRSLEEVKAHIDEHKHLPDIPSEAEVKENGISLGEMQSKLLQKIEELTLYVIDQNKRIEELEKENVRIKQKINKP